MEFRYQFKRIPLMKKRRRKSRQQRNLTKTQPPKSLQRIASKALQACVSLSEIEQTGPRKGKFAKGAKVAAGSGFFVAPDLIATNIHCVVGTTWVFVEPVSLPNAYPIESVVAFDDKIDLVILRVSIKGTPLSLADSDAVRIGEQIYAVRCVGGGIEERGARGAITPGTVHGIRDTDTHLRLQTILSHGNSGGPVINKAGEVIGIAVAGGSSVDEGSGKRVSDFAYAIPSKAVKRLLESDQAEEPFETWRERPRIHSYAEASHGYVKQSKGQYKAAIKHYTAALQLNPDLAELYHNRGTLKNILGQHKAAIADWDTALKYNPAFTEAYFNRGAAKNTLSDHEGGIADCSAALALNPDAMPAYYNRAQAKMELNRYAEGIADYDKALEFPMSEADAYGAYYNRALAKYLLGVEKAAAGEEEAAVELYHASIPDYTAAIKVAPDRILTGRNYNNRGYSKYLIAEYESAIGNMEEARELYEEAMIDSEEAIKLDRKNAYAYCTRAVTKVAFEVYGDAIDDFNRAIKLDPGFAHAYHQRGLAKRAIRQEKAAEADFRKAKQLDPNVGK